MKKILFLLIFMGFSPVAFGENYSIHKGEEVQRNILVEAFTSTSCSPCPAQLLAVEKYINARSNISFLTYHRLDQMSDKNTEAVLSRFTSTTPAFSVDRTIYPEINSIIYDSYKCSLKINERQQIPPEIAIDLKHKYNTETLQVDLDINLQTLKDIDKKCHLHVVVTEDSLDYPQLGAPTPYYHMHTVRSLITGTDGEQLNESVLAEGTNIQRSYSYTLKKSYKPENVRIVVFVSEGIMGPVYQAEEFFVVEDIMTEIDDISPCPFRVLAPYPNPFNPATTIEFSLLAATYVNLAMYDVLGRIIDLPVDRYLNAGTHRVIWDGHDRNGAELANGIYLFRLTAGEFTDHGKVILVR